MFFRKRDDVLKIKKLDFPLAEEALGMSKSDFAKRRLLTGDSCFSLPNNKSNSIDFDGKLYINVPCIGLTKGYSHTSISWYSHTSVRFDLNRVYSKKCCKKLYKVKSSLYRDEDNSLYYLIEDNKIIYVFAIFSYSITFLELYESDDKYDITALIGKGSYRFIISKSDYTITLHRGLI